MEKQGLKNEISKAGNQLKFSGSSNTGTIPNLPLAQSLGRLQVQVLAPTENAGAAGGSTAPTDAQVSIPRTGERVRAHGKGG